MSVQGGNACPVQPVLQKRVKRLIQPAELSIAGRDMLNMYNLVFVFGVTFQILKEGRRIHLA